MLSGERLLSLKVGEVQASEDEDKDGDISVVVHKVLYIMKKALYVVNISNDMSGLQK